MSLKLSPKQKNYYKTSNAKINISHGSVRSGKTFVTNLRWLNYIKNGPKGKLLMSGRTLATLKDNVLEDIFSIVGKENYTWKANGDLTIFGRKIKCIGADKIDAEAKIRGQTYAGWYGDEITIQHPAFVRQAITRCSIPKAMIFWTTNPDHPKHYIKKDFIDNEKMVEAGQVKNWHFLLEDNATLTKDYMDLLKASFSGVFYKRNIDGLWVIAEGIVYGEDYKPDLHIVPKEEIESMISNNLFVDYIAGTDWGYTHPMVGLLIGVTRDKKYYLIDEYYKTKQQTEDLANFYLKWEKRLERKIRVIFCDNAEPDRIVTLQKEGLRAKGADKKIAAGINSVQTVFKANRLYISNHCSNTDLELQTYRYPEEDDPKAAKDIPLDDDNHAMDALRYVIHNYELYLIGQERKEEKRKNRAERRAVK